MFCDVSGLQTNLLAKSCQSIQRNKRRANIKHITKQKPRKRQGRSQGYSPDKVTSIRASKVPVSAQFPVQKGLKRAFHTHPGIQGAWGPTWGSRRHGGRHDGSRDLCHCNSIEYSRRSSPFCEASWLLWALLWLSPSLSWLLGVQARKTRILKTRSENLGSSL